jgi:GDP-D-mannose dehydratase
MNHIDLKALQQQRAMLEMAHQQNVYTLATQLFVHRSFDTLSTRERATIAIADAKIFFEEVKRDCERMDKDVSTK